MSVPHITQTILTTMIVSVGTLSIPFTVLTATAAHGNEPVIHVAHRATYDGGPMENSVKGMGEVWKYLGGAEIDVRESKDHYPVLLHDSTLGRSTRCSGAVTGKTKDYLWNKCKVPNVAKVLPYFPKYKKVLLDIKVKLSKKAFSRLKSTLSGYKNKVVVFDTDNSENSRYRKAGFEVMPWSWTKPHRSKGILYNITDRANEFGPR